MSLNKEGLQHLWGKITNKINSLLETNLPEALGAIEFGGTQILRGTNFTDSFTTNGTWAYGHWRLASAAEDVGTRSFIEITDAPNGKIKLGWEIINSGTGVLDVAQNGIPVTVGQTYTMSCYARGTGLLKLQYGLGTYHSNTFLLENETSWKKYSYTFTVGAVEDGSSNGTTNIYFGNIVNASYTAGGTMQICGAKLEIGGVATDWNTAPGEEEHVRYIASPANIDLNDFIEQGIYYFNNQVTVTNKPTTSLGWLWNISRFEGADGISKQIWFRNATLGAGDDEIYIRSHDSNGNWGDWNRILTTKSIDTTLSVSGSVADAKATGDAITAVADQIPQHYHDWQYFYVNSTTGNDNNAGTESAPFASIEKAFEKLNEGWVNLRIYVTGAGTYEFSKNTFVGMCLHIENKSDGEVILQNSSNAITAFYSSHINSAGISWYGYNNGSNWQELYFEGCTTAIKNCTVLPRLKTYGGMLAADNITTAGAYITYCEANLDGLIVDLSKLGSDPTLNGNKFTTAFWAAQSNILFINNAVTYKLNNSADLAEIYHVDACHIRLMNDTFESVPTGLKSSFYRSDIFSTEDVKTALSNICTVDITNCSWQYDNRVGGTITGDVTIEGALTLNNALPITGGGTGATTAKEALKNLGGAGITYVRTAGTSCDDYTEYGIYYFASQTYAPTDIPVGVNGWLTVIPSDGGIFTKQFWTRAGTPGSNDHMTYVRTSNSGGWGDWQRFFTTKDIIPKANGGTGNANAIAENVSGVVEIANGGTGATDAATALTNLGALPNSGGNFGANTVRYNSPGSDGVISFYHSAASTGAGIWLYGNDNSGAGKFRLQVYDATNKKYRQFDGNPDGTLTWEKNKIYTAGDTIPITNGGTGATTVLDALSNLGLGVIRVQTEGTNLNNYKEYGIYSFTEGYVPTNIPTGVVNGWLLVLPMTMGYEGMVKQVFLRAGTLNDNDHEIYVRTLSDSTWSNWSKIQKDTGTNALSLTVSATQTAYDATASNFTAYYNGKMVDLYLVGKASADGNSSWTTVATLPTGYRPPKAVYMDVPYWDLTKNYQNLRLRITTAGAIQFAQGKSGATYNFHLSFLAI